MAVSLAVAAGGENLAGRLHVELGVRFYKLGHLVHLISHAFFAFRLRFKSHWVKWKSKLYNMLYHL